MTSWRWRLFRFAARRLGVRIIATGETGGELDIVLLARPGVDAAKCGEELITHLLVEDIRRDVAANPHQFPPPKAWHEAMPKHARVH
jgi:hypothetical protein